MLRPSSQQMSTDAASRPAASRGRLQDPREAAEIQERPETFRTPELAGTEGLSWHGWVHSGGAESLGSGHQSRAGASRHQSKAFVPPVGLAWALHVEKTLASAVGGHLCALWKGLHEWGGRFELSRVPLHPQGLAGGLGDSQHKKWLG